MSRLAWLSRAAWAAAPTGEAGLRKGFTADEIVAVPDADRTLRFSVSTGSVDREGDTIAPGGWHLDNYRKNPTVLWAHDYRQLPVARATTIGIESDRLVATAQFVPRDLSPFADTVYQMLTGGYLHGTSVGFRPLKHLYNDERHGYDFVEQELLEFSIVPVPANAECLIEARAAGLDLAPIRDWAEQWLSAEHGPGFWIARATLEGMWKAAAPAVTTVVLPKAEEPDYDCPKGDACPEDADDAHGRGCSMGGQCPMRSRSRDPDPDASVVDIDAMRAEVEDEVTEADVRAVFAELMQSAAEAAVCRLSGRLD